MNLADFTRVRLISSIPISRRTLLKGSLAGAMMLLASPLLGSVRSSPALPEGRLSLYNIHTNEKLEVTWRDSSGAYDENSLQELDYFLRCHYTQKVVPIDIRVIEFLNLVQKGVGGDFGVEIISGYRSPEYNDMLVREGRGAAKHSYHLQGRAIDFRIPQVGLETLRRVATNLLVGGVGYYPKSGFIHLDSGDVRSW